MLFHRLAIPFDNKLRTFIPYWRQYSSCCRIFQKNNSKITILNQISIMTCGRHMDLHPRFALKPSSRKMLEKALSSRELLEKSQVPPGRETAEREKKNHNSCERDSNRCSHQPKNLYLGVRLSSHHRLGSLR